MAKENAFISSTRNVLCGLTLLGILICSGSPVQASCNYPNWVPGYSGGNYHAGDIVKYTNGQYYQCTNDNPGYDPTVSTWFWSPFTCTDSGGGGGTCNYPNWVPGYSGGNYHTGDIVTYTNGQYYQCTHDNPGYDPTVSTWFWSSFACNGGGGGGSTTPTGYTWCANENDSYTFNQTVDTAYGANGSYNYRTGVSGTITFNNATFGDPAYGVAKAGYYKVVATTGPAGYTWCAGENGSYTFNQSVDVAYGANGAFAYKGGVSGNITFNNATFGDPIPGIVKAGYYKNSGGGGGVQKPGEVPSDQWSYMVSAASQLGMPADFAWLVAAMDRHESDFGAWLTGGSPSAGDGLMQVQPATRSAYSGSFSSAFGHAYDHGSYSDQIALGALIVKDMIVSYCGGGYRCGLMKYNGGPNFKPGDVDAYGRPILAEQYAAECMTYYQGYGGTHQ